MSYRTISQTKGNALTCAVTKGTKAIFTGDSYEKSLLHSLGTIEQKSRNLMTEGLKSHIYEFHNCMLHLSHSFPS